jgi:hypothetical protein
MLFLHVLLFSLIGTSVLAGGSEPGQEAGSPAVQLVDGFTVNILGELDGYWSWEDYVILVDKGKVLRYNPESRAYDKAFTNFETIAGDYLWRSKFFDGRLIVNGPTVI